MEFSTSSYQDEITRNKVNEITYSIKTINTALEYMNTHPTKRIVLEITFAAMEQAKITVPQLIKLVNENKQLYLDFFELQDMIDFAKASKLNSKYSFHYPVTTWNMFRILIDYKAAFITLGEPLVFNLPEIIELRDLGEFDYDIKFKVCPHSAGSIFNADKNGLNHFWFLPQHVSLYEPYIDVLILNDSNTLREKTLVNLYTSKESYNLSIKLLVTNLNADIKGKYVDEKWIKRRLTCGQVCQKSPSRCHYCETEYRIYKALAQREESPE